MDTGVAKTLVPVAAEGIASGGWRGLEMEPLVSREKGDERPK